MNRMGLASTIRSVFGKKRRGGRSSRRRQTAIDRRVESLEQRRVLAVDFVSASIVDGEPFFTAQADQELIPDAGTLTQSPQQVILRFTPGAEIDPASLGGISIVRSGSRGDGFESDGEGSEVDFSVVPGVVVVDDIPSTNQVVIRFQETLPDDSYRFTISSSVDPGTGEISGLRTVDGQAFRGGGSFSFDVQLSLAPQVVAVLPQPISRDLSDLTAPLTQDRDTIEVYFNAAEAIDSQSAETVDFYKLIEINDATGEDESGPGATTHPIKITYDSSSHKAVLQFFPGEIEDGKLYRLEIGGSGILFDPQVVPPTIGDAGSSFATALSAGILDEAGVTFSASIDPEGSIEMPGSLPDLQFPAQPGTVDEPGHRDIPVDYSNHGLDELGLESIAPPGTEIFTVPFNFQTHYGDDPQGSPLPNLITAEQKIRVREVFDLFSRYAGVRFVETDVEGITIAVGDTLVISDNSPPESMEGLSRGGIVDGEPTDDALAIINGNRDWGESEYGGDFFRSAMRQIGKVLGMWHSYDVPSILGESLPGEDVFPTDYDLIHLQQLFPRGGTDIDLYRFSLTEAGTLTAETIASRLPETGDASTLDTVLSVFSEEYDATATFEGGLASVVGKTAEIDGHITTVVGADTTVTAVGAVIDGFEAAVEGTSLTVAGAETSVVGRADTVVGVAAKVTGVEAAVQAVAARAVGTRATILEIAAQVVETATSTTTVVLDDVSAIEIDAPVSGLVGVPVGTTVTAIDTLANSVVLSNAVTLAVDSFLGFGISGDVAVTAGRFLVSDASAAAVGVAVNQVMLEDTTEAFLNDPEGIPVGTRVVDVDVNSRMVKFSSPINIAANDVLGFGSTTAQISLDEVAAIPVGANLGLRTGDQAVDSQRPRVVAVNELLGVITLSKPHDVAAGELLAFDHNPLPELSKPATSSRFYLDDVPEEIVEGLLVSAPQGIAAGTVVDAIERIDRNDDGVDEEFLVTFSQPVTLAVGASVGFGFSGTTVTVDDASAIRTGAIVEGMGVPEQTRVSSINASTGEIRLSTSVNVPDGIHLGFSLPDTGTVTSDRLVLLTGGRGIAVNAGLYATDGSNLGASVSRVDGRVVTLSGAVSVAAASEVAFGVTGHTVYVADAQGIEVGSLVTAGGGVGSSVVVASVDQELGRVILSEAVTLPHKAAVQFGFFGDRVTVADASGVEVGAPLSANVGVKEGVTITGKDGNTLTLSDRVSVAHGSELNVGNAGTTVVLDDVSGIADDVKVTGVGVPEGTRVAAGGVDLVNKTVTLDTAVVVAADAMLGFGTNLATIEIDSSSYSGELVNADISVNGVPAPAGVKVDSINGSTVTLTGGSLDVADGDRIGFTFTGPLTTSQLIVDDVSQVTEGGELDGQVGVTVTGVDQSSKMVTLSQAVSFSSGDSAVFGYGGTQIEVADLSEIVVGSPLAGTGIPDGTSVATITPNDPSDLTKGGLVTLSGTVAIAHNESISIGFYGNTVRLVDASGITVGAPVNGLPGVRPGTTVVSGNLSRTVNGDVTNLDTIVITSTTGVVDGMAVIGAGVPPGTVVTNVVDGVTLTLSQAVNILDGDELSIGWNELVLSQAILASSGELLQFGTLSSSIFGPTKVYLNDTSNIVAKDLSDPSNPIAGTKVSGLPGVSDSETFTVVGKGTDADGDWIEVEGSHVIEAGRPLKYSQTQSTVPIPQANLRGDVVANAVVTLNGVSTGVTVVSYDSQNEQLQLSSSITYTDGDLLGFGTPARELIARNDNAFGRDSFLELDLEAGNYFVAVTSVGNTDFNPAIEQSGGGGRTQGAYDLRLKFKEVVDSSTTIVDDSSTPLDGDRDGHAGEAFNFWFRTASETNGTVYVDKLKFDAELTSATATSNGSQIVVATSSGVAVGMEVVADGVPAGTTIADINGTTLTLSDDVSVGVGQILRFATTGSGSLNDPYRNIDDAIADAAGDPAKSIIRIVGNTGVELSSLTIAGTTRSLRPNALAMETNPHHYYVGFDEFGNPLTDGASLTVPAGVTLMVDPGTVLRMGRANIEVGSSSELDSRVEASLQILGVPEQPARITSAIQGAAIGEQSRGPVPEGGDWGGLVLRADSDWQPALGEVLAHSTLRPFLNTINHTVIEYAGGAVEVDSETHSFAAIQLENARPNLGFNQILRSASHAIAATPNSFLEAGGRAGPQLTGNRLLLNSTNGLFINIRTEYGVPLDTLEVAASLTSTEVTYVLQENLVVEGGQGSYYKDTGGSIRTHNSGRLAIAPGVVLKLQNARIELERGAAQLLAEGTPSQPVVFTNLGDYRFGAGGTFNTNGNLPDEYGPGRWGGIVLNAGSQASIDNAFITGGGGEVPIEGSLDRFNVIEVHQGDLRLANSRLQSNSDGTASTDRTARGGNEAATIFIRGAQPVIIGNDFRDNAGATISINANSMTDRFLADPGRQSGLISRFEAYDDNFGPLMRDNRISYATSEPIVVGYDESPLLPPDELPADGSVQQIFWKGQKVDVLTNSWVVRASTDQVGPINFVSGWTAEGIGGGFYKVTAPGAGVRDVLAWADGNATVSYAEPNFLLRNQRMASDPRFGELWGLDNTGQNGGLIDADIDAPEAWDITTGSNEVVIAVIDTGVDYSHEDLAANIWVNPGEVPGDGIDNDGNGYIDDIRGWDFANEDNDPMDTDGHGTHVAGTIGAVANNGIGVTGVAWNVKILPIKFLDPFGSTTDAIESVQYVTSLRQQGINVVASNNSWGGGGYSQGLFDAIEAGGQAGVLFVAAAGNDSNDNDQNPAYPTSYESDAILSVAATDRNNNLAGFSNYGATSVDIGAPGVSILSTVPGNTYASYNGTSMAAPHASGVVALLAAAAPEATMAEIRQAIIDGAVPVQSLVGNVASNALLNAAGALAAISGGGVTRTAGVVIRGEEIVVNSVWDDTDMVHVLRDEIIVNNLHTATNLRLLSQADASLVVKLTGANAGFTASGEQLDIDDRVGGTVQVIGQPGFPVVLTSLSDDTVGASLDAYGFPVTDTNVDGSFSQPGPGDWRSLQFLPLSNDRNVGMARELELPFTSSDVDANSETSTAEFLGTLAPNYATNGNTWESAQEKSGDENRRLGFDVSGTIAFNDPTDVDVYSFDGYAGSEVWIDIDQTSTSLDTMIEVLDAGGHVLARSVDSQTDTGIVRGASVAEEAGGVTNVVGDQTTVEGSSTNATGVAAKALGVIAEAVGVATLVEGAATKVVGVGGVVVGDSLAISEIAKEVVGRTGNVQGLGVLVSEAVDNQFIVNVDSDDGIQVGAVVTRDDDGSFLGIVQSTSSDGFEGFEGPEFIRLNNQVTLPADIRLNVVNRGTNFTLVANDLQGMQDQIVGARVRGNVQGGGAIPATTTVVSFNEGTGELVLSQSLSLVHNTELTFDYNQSSVIRVDQVTGVGVGASLFVNGVDTGRVVTGFAAGNEVQLDGLVDVAHDALVGFTFDATNVSRIVVDTATPPEIGSRYRLTTGLIGTVQDVRSMGASKHLVVLENISAIATGDVVEFGPIVDDGGAFTVDDAAAIELGATVRRGGEIIGNVASKFGNILTIGLDDPAAEYQFDPGEILAFSLTFPSAAPVSRIVVDDSRGIVVGQSVTEIAGVPLPAATVLTAVRQTVDPAVNIITLDNPVSVRPSDVVAVTLVSSNSLQQFTVQSAAGVSVGAPVSVDGVQRFDSSNRPIVVEEVVTGAGEYIKLSEALNIEEAANIAFGYAVEDGVSIEVDDATNISDSLGAESTFYIDGVKVGSVANVTGTTVTVGLDDPTDSLLLAAGDFAGFGFGSGVVPAAARRFLVDSAEGLNAPDVLQSINGLPDGVTQLVSVVINDNGDDSDIEADGLLLDADILPAASDALLAFDVDAANQPATARRIAVADASQAVIGSIVTVNGAVMRNADGIPITVLSDVVTGAGEAVHISSPVVTSAGDTIGFGFNGTVIDVDSVVDAVQGVQVVFRDNQGVTLDIPAGTRVDSFDSNLNQITLTEPVAVPDGAILEFGYVGTQFTVANPDDITVGSTLYGEGIPPETVVTDVQPDGTITADNAVDVFGSQEVGVTRYYELDSRPVLPGSLRGVIFEEGRAIQQFSSTRDGQLVFESIGSPLRLFTTGFINYETANLSLDWNDSGAIPGQTSVLVDYEYANLALETLGFTATGGNGRYSLQKDAFRGGDFYTTNPRDAGLRLILPGTEGVKQKYFMRVRSQPDAGSDKATYEQNLVAASPLAAGLTSGNYDLSLRLRQRDEQPGSTVRFADIRYPVTGIDVLGLPNNSPLVGTAAEHATDLNDLFENAQPLGNLLSSDRNAINVSGEISDEGDIDWYSFTMSYEDIQSLAGHNDGLKTWSTVFDIDYASGFRGDLTLSVFDQEGRLIYIGRDSNIADDQPGVGQEGGDVDDLSRGSFSTQDPFIGPAHLPAGSPGIFEPRTYYVAVSSNSHLPAVLDQTFVASASNANIRLEPVTSSKRIIDDRLSPSSEGEGATSGTLTYREDAESVLERRRLSTGTAFDLPEDRFSGSPWLSLDTHIRPFTLSDLTLYVSTASGLHVANPFTGDIRYRLPAGASGISGLQDIDMRTDGTLFGYTGPGNDAENNGVLFEISTETGAQVGDQLGDDIADDPDTPTDFNITGNSVDAVAIRRTGNFDSPSYEEIYYSIRDPAIGNRSVLYRGGADGDTDVENGPEGRMGVIGDNLPLGVIQGATTGLQHQNDTGNLYGVSSGGQFYRINSGTGAVSDVVDFAEELGGVGFQGLAAAPVNLEHGRYQGMFFAITAPGNRLVCIDPTGGEDGTAAILDNVFDTDGDGLGDSYFSNQLSLFSPTGLAFSPLDVNLWHPTGERWYDENGIPYLPDESRYPGGQENTYTELNFYFGLENYRVNGGNVDGNYWQYDAANTGFYVNGQYGVQGNGYAWQADLTSSADIGGNYNTPGGAHGSLITNSFSLADYSAADRPVLYFDYFLETEGAEADDQSERMLDAARVFASSDGGRTWELLATNNSDRSAFDDFAYQSELPPVPSVSDDLSEAGYGHFDAKWVENQHVQELYDAAQWRQARVDLGRFAGEADIRLRYDFSTAGDYELYENSKTAIDATREVLAYVEHQVAVEALASTVITLESTEGLTAGLSVRPADNAWEGTVLSVSHEEGSITLDTPQSIPVGTVLSFSLPTTSELKVDAVDGLALGMLVRPFGDSYVGGAAGGSWHAKIVGIDSVASVVSLDVQIPVITGDVVTFTQQGDLRNNIVGFAGHLGANNHNWSGQADDGAADNDYEGFRIDNIIVGFAERGEIVGRANTDTTFYDLGSPVSVEYPEQALAGEYTLEIRRGTEYAVEPFQTSDSTMQRRDIGGTAIVAQYDTNTRFVEAGVDESFLLASNEFETVDGVKVQHVGNGVADTSGDGILLTHSSASPSSNNLLRWEVDLEGADEAILNYHAEVGSEEVLATLPETFKTGAVASLALEDSVLAGDARAIELSAAENRAFVATYDGGLQIFDLTDPLLPVLMGSITASQQWTAQDLAVSPTGNHIYVTDVTGEGLGGIKIVSVLDPANPQIVGTATSEEGGVGVDVWADVVNGKEYVFLATDEAGVQIYEVDVTTATQPVITGPISSVTDLGYRSSGGSSRTDTQDVVISADGTHLYVADGIYGLRIINVSNPTNPAVIGQFDLTQAAGNRRRYRSIALSSDEQTVYAAAGRDGLHILDVSDVQNPVLVSRAASVSGLDSCRDVKLSPDGEHVLLAFEGKGVEVWDVSSPTIPTLVRQGDGTGTRSLTVAGSGSRVYAATSSALAVYEADMTGGGTQGIPTGDGVAVSLDGGVNWKRVASFTNFDRQATDLVGAVGPLSANTVIGFFQSGDSEVRSGIRISDVSVTTGREAAVTGTLGDANNRHEFEQGQFIIQSNIISHAAQYGVSIDAGRSDNEPDLGATRNLLVLNHAGLVPGVVVSNNIISGAERSGVLFSGTASSSNQPQSAVPFGRIINNTIYGGEESAAVGIEVTENASPTIMNNVFAELATGVRVDASSGSDGNGIERTVLESSAFYAVGVDVVGVDRSDRDATLVQSPFINASAGNFYPSDQSAIVDRSLSSLQDRNEYRVVTEPLGVAPSPIVAPGRDIYGQLRIDDPQQANQPGLGGSVFQDLGAVERADLSRPYGRVVVPLDQGAEPFDSDASLDSVVIEGVEARGIRHIAIQLNDAGVGIDKSTVSSDAFVVTRDGVRLLDTIDYRWVYNRNTDQVVFQAISVFPLGEYLIEVDSVAADSANGIAGKVTDRANNPLRANAENGRTTFFVVLADVPGAVKSLQAQPNGTEVSITWSAPLAMTSKPIVQYTVQWQEIGTASWNEEVVTSESLVLPSIDNSAAIPYDTPYAFRVAAENAVGRGVFTEGQFTLREPAAAPVIGTGAAGYDVVKELSVIDLDWTDVTAPNPGLHVLVDYRVEYREFGASEWLHEIADASTQSSARITANGVGFTPDTEYEFRVRAVTEIVGTSEQVQGEVSAVMMVKAEGLPGVPTDLESSFNSDGTLKVQWVPPVFDGATPVTGYELDYSLVNPATSSAGWSAPLSTSLTSYDLPGSLGDPGADIWVRVRAVNKHGASPNSDVSAKFTLPNVPAGAIEINDGLESNQQIELFWSYTPPAEGESAVSGYNIERRESVGGGSWTAWSLVVSDTNSPHTDTGLVNGRAYQYRITALNEIGPGVAVLSDSLTPRTTASQPGKPVGSPGDRLVALVWTAPGNDGGTPITDYLIEITEDDPAGAGPVDWQLYDDLVRAEPSSATVAGLDNGTQYWFRITAKTAVLGNPSVPSEGYVPVGPAAAPTSVIASVPPGESQTVDLQWTAPTADGGSSIVGYSVQYSTDNGNSWDAASTDGSLAINADVTGETARVTGLTNSIAYSFRVAAITTRTGLFSIRSSLVVPVDGADAPEILQEQITIGTTQIKFFWKDPDRGYGGAVVDYEVEWRLVDGTVQRSFTGGNKEFEITGLDPGAEYEFRIRARLSNGTTSKWTTENDTGPWERVTTNLN